MSLGRIDLQAGDFKPGLEHQYLRKKFLMKRKGRFFRESISVAEVIKLEIATEESVVSLGGAAGWGVAGGVLLGPVGLLAGLLLGGKGKDITFICAFKDGRKFLGKTSEKTFNELKTDLSVLNF